MSENMLYKYPATTGQKVDVDFLTFDYIIVQDDEVDAKLIDGWFTHFVAAKEAYDAKTQEKAEELLNAGKKGK